MKRLDEEGIPWITDVFPYHSRKVVSIGIHSAVEKTGANKCKEFQPKESHVEAVSLKTKKI